MATVDLITPAYHGFPVSRRTQRSLDIECMLDTDVHSLISIDGDNLPQCRNIAIDRSGADFLLPLDADDWLEVGAANLLKKALEQHPECDVAYGHWIEVWQDRMETIPALDWTRENCARRTLTSYSMMFTKRIWEKVGRYDETMTAAEDWEFQARILLSGASAVVLNIPTLYHLNRDDSKIRVDMARLGGFDGILAMMKERVGELWNA